MHQEITGSISRPTHWQDSLSREQYLGFLAGGPSNTLGNQLSLSWRCYDHLEHQDGQPSWREFLDTYFGDEPTRDWPYFEDLPCREQPLRAVLNPELRAQPEPQEVTGPGLRHWARQLAKPEYAGKIIVVYAEPGHGKTQFQLYLLYHFLLNSDVLLPCWLSCPDDLQDLNAAKIRHRMLQGISGWQEASEKLISYAYRSKVQNTLWLADGNEAPRGQLENWLQALVTFWRYQQKGTDRLVLTLRRSTAASQESALKALEASGLEVVVWEPQPMTSTQVRQALSRWNWWQPEHLQTLLGHPLVLGLRSARVDEQTWQSLQALGGERLGFFLLLVTRRLLESKLNTEISKGLPTALKAQPDSLEHLQLETELPEKLHWLERYLIALTEEMKAETTLPLRKVYRHFERWLETAGILQRFGPLNPDETDAAVARLWGILTQTLLTVEANQVRFIHELIQEYYRVLSWGYDPQSRLQDVDAADLGDKLRVWLSGTTRIPQLMIELWGQSGPGIMATWQDWSAAEWEQLALDLLDGAEHLEWADEACIRVLNLDRTRFVAPANLGRTYMNYHRLPEAKRWLETTLANVQTLDAASKLPDRNDLANVLMNLGVTLHYMNELGLARERYEETLGIRCSLDAAGRLSDRNDLALVLMNLGATLRDMNELRPARERLEEALKITRALDIAGRLPERSHLVAVLVNLGNVLSSMNELGLARERYEEALEITRALDAADRLPDRNDLAKVLVNLGVILRDMNELRPARERLEEALEITRALDAAGRLPDRNDLAIVLLNLGVILRGMNELGLARERYEEALEIRRALDAAGELPDRNDLAIVLFNLGVILRDMNELSLAQVLFEEAFEIMRALDAAGRLSDRNHLAMVLVNLGEVMLKTDHPAEAERYFHEAQEINASWAQRIQQMRADKPARQASFFRRCLNAVKRFLIR